MATQKKDTAKKGIKVRDLKPTKDAKGGVHRQLNVRSADTRKADARGLSSKGLS